jgi:amidophosphoribosyltransferase
MGGLFGVVSKEECNLDLFYGTDYHSHFGTMRGGMAVRQNGSYSRIIHNIENTQFRSKFEMELPKLSGHSGIGCISDTDDQPLIIGSHLGNYCLTTVGCINNIQTLVNKTFKQYPVHFAELGSGEISPTELIATLINRESSLTAGIQHAQQAIDGSCSMVLLTATGIIAARDLYGRTPLIIGKKDNAFCVTMETCAFPNLGYRFLYELGPGEIVQLTPDGMEKLAHAHDRLRICAFLWIYYGYPASNYEGRNVEVVRNRSGKILAQNDNIEVDIIAGIPDSGTAHAVGYANTSGLPYMRPFVKYTPTWPRSFMPQDQDVRNIVARMKLIPIEELIKDKRLLFCEDSIVRGTQLRETIQRLYDYGANEVHMRPACPPLIYGCRFLNFSLSKSELDLAGRKAIRELLGNEDAPPEVYADASTEEYRSMVDRVRKHLNLTTLTYQTLPHMLEAIGLPKEKVCTYCWDGKG